MPAELKAALQARSAERVKKSAEFAKLAKEIEQVKARVDRKTIPLNEQELREQVGQEGADKSGTRDSLLPPDPPADKPYKFERNFVHDEILQITEDFLQGKKLLSGR